MFDAVKFKILLERAIGDNTITQFSNKSNVNRSYLSKFLNNKLDKPPTPDILKKISTSTDNVNYIELMVAAGYLDKKYLISDLDINYDNINIFNVEHKVPIYKNLYYDNDKLIYPDEDIIGYRKINQGYNIENYFFYKVKDNFMKSARIMKNDLVLIDKDSNSPDGEIYLVFYYDKVKLLRATTEYGDYYFKNDNPRKFFPHFNCYNENIKIIGKVIEIIIIPKYKPLSVEI